MEARKSSPIEELFAEDQKMKMNPETLVRDEEVVRMSKRELLDEMRKEKKNHHLQIRYVLMIVFVVRMIKRELLDEMRKKEKS